VVLVIGLCRRIKLTSSAINLRSYTSCPTIEQLNAPPPKRLDSSDEEIEEKKVCHVPCRVGCMRTVNCNDTDH
jgi:hypothetical protein